MEFFFCLRMVCDFFVFHLPTESQRARTYPYNCWIILLTVATIATSVVVTLVGDSNFTSASNRVRQSNTNNTNK